MPCRILLVDDFAPWRRSVCSILSDNPQLEVVGEASDAGEAIQKAQELRPDLVLLDIGLPSLNGIQAAARLRSVIPNSNIIFLSQNNDREIVRAALSDGARGYVLKTFAGRELVSAIEAVQNGRTFLSPALRV